MMPVVLFIYACWRAADFPTCVVVFMPPGTDTHFKLDHIIIIIIMT